jgi:peptidoglycan/xylan/chitin deacetylase (PgdA/CDA1 family)
MRKLILMTIVLFTLGTCTVIPSLSASKPTTWFRDQVAVLMYHHIHDLAKSGDTITVQLFSDQINYLRDKGYQFITLKQFKDYLAGGSVPDNAALVTFDDGYESFYNNAYPILKKLRVPAVNFIITKDLDNPLASYIPSLSDDEIVEMTHDTNFIDAQCHTNALHSLTTAGEAPLTTLLTINGVKETTDQYKQRILTDTKLCIKDLQGLYPTTVDSLAYPFGTYDKRAADLVHEAGINYAFTTVPEMTTRSVDPLQIPRFNGGSPWITPEGLHNTIIRHIVAVDNPNSKVNLKTTLDQLGGQLVEGQGGTLQIHFRGNMYVGKIGGTQFTSSTSKTFTLKQNVVTKNGTITMSLDDLQTMLAVRIVYNPNTRKFSTRLTPNAAVKLAKSGS